MAACPLIDWRRGLDAGDLSATFLVHASLDLMAKQEKRLQALLHRSEAKSLSLAAEADAHLLQGKRSPMLGIPIVIKDNIHWKDVPTSNGSRMTAGSLSSYTATVLARMLQAGAIPIAKANMDEFAMGSSGEHSAFGPARNPWDLSRTPGGSSSGSVASVASGYAPFALGTDTGGSVRLPASFCNVTALRPTYGVLSRFGVTAMASSLDQVGSIAGSAEDLAAGFSVMVGADPLDATSVALPDANRLFPLQPRTLRGLRIGLPKECFGPGLEPAVRDVLGTAIQQLASEGAEPVEVSLPHATYAIETYYLICTSEVSSNMSRFDGVRYGLRQDAATLHGMMADSRDRGFGPEVKRRVLLGAFCLSRGYYDAFYLKALKARTLIARDFAEAFREVDVLLTPVSPTLPFKLGSKTQDPLAMYLADIFTVPASLAALPCLSLPAGFSGATAEHPSLPIGMQLIGPALSDVKLLEWGHAFQLITDHHRKSPPLDV